MKRTITIDDEVDAQVQDLPRSQMPTLSGLVTDALRDYLDDPAAFDRRRRARIRRETQAAQAQPVGAGAKA